MSDTSIAISPGRPSTKRNRSGATAVTTAATTPPRRPWKRYIGGFCLFSCIIIYRHASQSDSLLAITDVSTSRFSAAAVEKTDLKRLLKDARVALDVERGVVSRLRLELLTNGRSTAAAVAVAAVAECPVCTCAALAPCPSLVCLPPPPPQILASTAAPAGTASASASASASAAAGGGVDDFADAAAWTNSTTNLPLSTTVDCSMTSDGGDLCVYSNICFDISDPVSPTMTIPVFLGDPLIDAQLEAGVAGAGGSRYSNLRDRWPLWSVRTLVENGFQGGFSWDYEDILTSRPGMYARSVPFGSHMASPIWAKTAAGVPQALGGDAPGTVVWTDSLWVASNILADHLWGFAASVGTPLVAAVVANSTRSVIPLPPLRALLVGGAAGAESDISRKADIGGQPYHSDSQPHGWGWAFGFLHSALHFLTGSPPFLGSGRVATLSPGGVDTRRDDAARRQILKDWAADRAAGTAFLNEPPTRAASVLSILLGSWAARNDAGASGGAPGAIFGGAPGAIFDVGVVVKTLLAPCAGSSGASADSLSSPFNLPPAPGPEFIIFSVSASEQGNELGQFSRAIWCAVSLLARKNEMAVGALDVKSLAYADSTVTAEDEAKERDKRPPGSDDAWPLTRDIPRPTRLVFTAADLPSPADSREALAWAMSQALSILGENPGGDWAAAVLKTQPPWPEAPLIVKSVPGDASLSPLVSTPRLAAFAFWLNSRKTRLCARRALSLGAKETLVGGQIEGNAYREWATEVRKRVGSTLLTSLFPSVAAPPLYPTLTSVSGEPVEGLRGGDIPVSGIAGAVPILLLDRGKEVNGITTSGYYGRRFHNRDAMEAVLNKYNLNYSIVEDSDLQSLSFEQHVALLNAARIVIVAHSAGMNNALFLPPRSAIIEISSAGMWCPIYSRALAAAGHHVFPIYSNLIAPQQDYAFSYGRVDYEQKVREFRIRCEPMGHVRGSLDAGELR